MSNHSSRSWAICAALALATPTTAFAEARLHNSPVGPVDGVIYTCVSRNDGDIRVINPTAGGRCRNYETLIYWSQSGSSGASGAMGPARAASKGCASP